MADEVTIQFRVPEGPDALRVRWRADPPPFIREQGYELADESYDSLVYERDHSKWSKIVTWGFGKTIYRLTLTFSDDGTAYGANVTVSGKAPEEGAAAKAFAEQHGGWHDPRVRR